MDPITHIALLLRGWLRILKGSGLPLNSWPKRFLKTFIPRFLRSQKHNNTQNYHRKCENRAILSPQIYSPNIHLKQKKTSKLAAAERSGVIPVASMGRTGPVYLPIHEMVDFSDKCRYYTIPMDLMEESFRVNSFVIFPIFCGWNWECCSQKSIHKKADSMNGWFTSQSHPFCEKENHLNQTSINTQTTTIVGGWVTHLKHLLVKLDHETPRIRVQFL